MSQLENLTPGESPNLCFLNSPQSPCSQYQTTFDGLNLANTKANTLLQTQSEDREGVNFCKQNSYEPSDEVNKCEQICESDVCTQQEQFVITMINKFQQLERDQQEKENLLEISKKKSISEFLLKVRSISSITLYRLMHILILFGAYAYNLIWFLFASGAVDQDVSESQPQIQTDSTQQLAQQPSQQQGLTSIQNISIIDSQDIFQVCIIASYIILSSISFLIQILTNLNIVCLTKSRQMIKQSHLNILILSLWVFDLGSFCLFLYYSWSIDSNFKFAGIVVFIITLFNQKLIIYKYTFVLYQMGQLQSHYHLDPLEVLQKMDQ